MAEAVFRAMVSPGLLLVDKPAGMSSAAVVTIVKRMTGASKVGHGGTLDPFATGLLPILVGREATRDAERLLGGDKAYRITVRFGSETDTGDLTGRVVSRGPGPWPSLAAIADALPAFVGEVLQEPPAYSALKLDGRPLYWYARHGQTVVKPARPIVIHAVEVVEYLAPDVVLDVRCGKGAYMRSLGRDLGRALACGAHLVALRRTAVGPHLVENAVPLWRLAGR